MCAMTSQIILGDLPGGTSNYFCKGVLAIILLKLSAFSGTSDFTFGHAGTQGLASRDYNWPSSHALPSYELKQETYPFTELHTNYD